MISLGFPEYYFAHFTSANHCSCCSFTVVNLMPCTTSMFLAQSSSRKTGLCAFRLLQLLGTICFLEYYVHSVALVAEPQSGADGHLKCWV